MPYSKNIQEINIDTMIEPYIISSTSAFLTLFQFPRLQAIARKMSGISCLWARITCREGKAEQYPFSELSN